MTDQERQQADVLLGRIETATGALQDRTGMNASLMAEILEAVNGLRSIVGAVRAH